MNEDKDRTIQFISEVLACALTPNKSLTDSQLLRLAERIQLHVHITLENMCGLDFDWAFAADYFNQLACEALDGRVG